MRRSSILSLVYMLSAKRRTPSTGGRALASAGQQTMKAMRRGERKQSDELLISFGKVEVLNFRFASLESENDWSLCKLWTPSLASKLQDEPIRFDPRK